VVGSGTVEDGAVVVDVAGSVDVVVGDVVVVSATVVVGISAGGSGGRTSTTDVVVATGARRFFLGAVVSGIVLGSGDATGGSVTATVVGRAVAGEVPGIEVDGAWAISGIV
jgi:hypothetical protein